MSNFTDFFPAASAVTGGGGGGFTKMKKYSTGASTGETTNPQEIMAPGLTPAELSSVGRPNVRVNSISNGGTTAGLSYWKIGTSFWTTTADSTLPLNFFVGGRFELLKTTGGYETITITASTAGFISNNNAVNSTITFNAFDSGGSGAFNDNTTQYYILPPLLTFNPQTEGMSDGDSIGFLLAGGNATGVLRGTAIITNASTDLVMTPGLSSGTASTITGGLTLTSADGSLSNSIGYLLTSNNVATPVPGGQGIDGYGVGRQHSGTQSEGYGGYGKDGAILLFY